MEGSDLSDSPEISLSSPQKARTGPLIRPSQYESEVNGSVGGEKGWAERKGETEEEIEKRIEGAKRAEQREMVRRAARRGVVFGFVVEGDQGTMQHSNKDGHPKGRKHRDDKDTEPQKSAEPSRRKCEAIMQGQVVEPSFAKGDWAIRWRE